MKTATTYSTRGKGVLFVQRGNLPDCLVRKFFWIEGIVALSLLFDN